MTVQVEVIDGNIDGALRDLKKKVERDGIHKEVKRRLAFVKPSMKRRAKQAMARQRLKEMEKKKAMRLENKGRRVYDPNFEIRRFNLSHRIDG
jgi:small subunit ribosomal protein S21